MTPIQQMDRAVRCLYLELPESIADDVKNKWQAAKEYAASQCGGRWVNPFEIDLTLKTGEYFGKYNDVEKCFVVVQGGDVVSLKFSNGARMTNEWRDMKKLNILMYDETPSHCPHEEEVKRLKERIFLLETQLNHSQNDSPF